MFNTQAHTHSRTHTRLQTLATTRQDARTPISTSRRCHRQFCWAARASTALRLACSCLVLSAKDPKTTPQSSAGGKSKPLASSRVRQEASLDCCCGHQRGCTIAPLLRSIDAMGAASFHRGDGDPPTVPARRRRLQGSWTGCREPAAEAGGHFGHRGRPAGGEAAAAADGSWWQLTGGNGREVTWNGRLTATPGLLTTPRLGLPTGERGGVPGGGGCAAGTAALETNLARSIPPTGCGESLVDRAGLEGGVAPSCSHTHMLKRSWKQRSNAAKAQQRLGKLTALPKSRRPLPSPADMAPSPSRAGPSGCALAWDASGSASPLFCVKACRSSSSWAIFSGQ